LASGLEKALPSVALLLAGFRGEFRGDEAPLLRLRGEVLMVWNCVSIRILLLLVLDGRLDFGRYGYELLLRQTCGRAPCERRITLHAEISRTTSEIYMTASISRNQFF